MKHITLYESYDTLAISENHELNTITNKESDELFRYVEKNKLDKDNIIWGRNNITFINYVGYIKLSSFSIEILPKINLHESNYEEGRKSLINMLQKCRIIKVNYSNLGLLNIYKMNLNEIFAYFFAKTLQGELAKGPYLEYVYFEDNITALKGKLLIQKHINNIATQSSRVACRFEEFSKDNVLNQIFIYCILKLLTNVKNNDTIKSLRHSMANLTEVTNIQICNKEMLNYKFNRVNIRFKEAFILAKILINGYSAIGNNGSNESFSILFKMNEVFEKYICNILISNVKDGIVYPQHNKYKLMIKEDSNRSIFQLKPDVVIEKDGIEKIIVDTKWKRIDSSYNRHGVKREDLYQMYAYLTRYKDAETVILLYPYNTSINTGDKEYLESWYLDGMPDKKIRVHTVDLSEESKTIDELNKILELNRSTR